MTLIRPLVSSCSPSDVDPFDPAVVLERHRAELLHLEALRLGRAAIDVDVLDRDLVGAYWYSSSRSRNRSKPSERSNTRMFDRPFEPLQHLLGLIGQRELLGRGQVPPLVPSRGQVVDPDQDREHHRDAGKRQRAEARLPAGERANDLAPLAEDVEERADQARDRQPVVERLLLGPEEADRDGCKDQRDAEPAEKSEDAFQHELSPSTVRCRPTSPSGRGRR